MNTHQAEMVLRLINGHWPAPEMSDDELRVWHRTLGPLDARMSAEIIDALALTGMDYRPTDGRFLFEYRHSLNRRRPFPALSSEPVASAETTAAGLAECRALLNREAS